MKNKKHIIITHRIVLFIALMMTVLNTQAQQLATPEQHKQVADAVTQLAFNKVAEDYLNGFAPDSAYALLQAAADIGMIPDFEATYYHTLNLCTRYYDDINLPEYAKASAWKTVKLIEDNAHTHLHHEYLNAIALQARHIDNPYEKFDVLLRAFHHGFTPVTHYDSIHYVIDYLKLGGEFLSSAGPSYAIVCSEVCENFCKKYYEDGVDSFGFPIFTLRSTGYFSIEKYKEAREYLELAEKYLYTFNDRQVANTNAALALGRVLADLYAHSSKSTTTLDVIMAFGATIKADSIGLAWRNRDERNRFIYAQTRKSELLHAACIECKRGDLAFDIALEMKSRYIRYQTQRKTGKRTMWKEVQSLLGKDEAAIEFISFRGFPHNYNAPSRAAAIILTNEKAPEIIRFDDIDSIGGLDICWKIIHEHLDSIKTIYYSPAGQFARINPAAIPLYATKVCLGDYCDFHLLTSTSSTASNFNDTDNFKSAVLFGNIDYGSKTASSLWREGVNPLDNSIIEINNIANRFKKRKIKAVIKQEKMASKTSFLALNGHAPDIIHISTHGFTETNYRNPKPSEDNPLAELLNLNAPDPDNPMCHCGLLLAGANRAWTTGQSEPGQDDGILTAEEIAALDLSGCRMVVLSACETGLGDATDYEGVLGLQRAFKLAGVQTIVMSLWRVRDDVTALLMTRFYDHLLTEKVTPHEAMRRAQRDVRRDFPDPHNWAAFVVLDG